MAYPVNPNMTPAQRDRAMQCAMLPQLRQALYSLMAGQQRSEVRDGDRHTTWHAGNVKELRAEIRKLESLCLGCPGAVQAGPGRSPFDPFRRY